MSASPSASVKLAGFAVAVAVVFAAAFGVARAVAPDGLSDRPSGGHDMAPGMDMADNGGGDGAAHGDEPTAGPAAAAAVPGLAVAEAGYRFVADATTLDPDPAAPFRFRIDGPDGAALQRYEELHERELHLIVVRRDLTGFQHVHPTRAADGTWSTTLDLRQGGTWRAFADFAPVGGPAQLTLGVDLQVPGAFVPGPAPAAATPADPALAASFDRRGDDVDITVRRNGVAIDPEPYLGARGHLVALRAGDLGYLHVHPRDGGAPAVRFTAELPTPGTYALFFDYQIGGTVTTAATTTEVR